MIDMAAECQIDNCGVLAVGRCGVCGRAFCPTHQGRSMIMGLWVPYIDMCAPCANAKRAEENKRAEEEQAPRKYLESGKALDDLYSSGVQPVKIYWVERRREWKTKGIFRQRVREEVEVATPIGNGWILSKFGGQDGSSKNYFTAVVDLSPEESGKFGLYHTYLKRLARVRPYSDGYEIIKGMDIWDSEWKEAAQAVRRLTGKPS